eukprot:scaffold15937_cov141-Skeletonema_marinoi.AAC.2
MDGEGLFLQLTFLNHSQAKAPRTLGLERKTGGRYLHDHKAAILATSKAQLSALQSAKVVSTETP